LGGWFFCYGFPLLFVSWLSNFLWLAALYGRLNLGTGSMGEALCHRRPRLRGACGAARLA
jgi:hypothetical protein